MSDRAPDIFRGSEPEASKRHLMHDGQVDVDVRLRRDQDAMVVRRSADRTVHTRTPLDNLSSIQFALHAIIPPLEGRCDG